MYLNVINVHKFTNILTLLVKIVIIYECANISSKNVLVFIA